MQITPGQILLNRYQILDILGKGGMGTVYKAYDPMLQRIVAIKVLSQQADTEFVARFKREAVLSANLRHPNIVTVYDVGHESGEDFIIMEFLEGTTLDHVLERVGPMTMAQASKIVNQIADALDHAHSRSMVHRDVKPSNIMLDAQDRAVLMDFGLVRAVDAQGLTSKSVIMGTPDYMAPEQVLGQAVDRRADIYALGVVIFETLTSRTPFAHTTPIATAHAHVYEPPPPLRTVNKSLPKSTEAVVMKALSKNPAERYQSAGHLAHDFALSINGTMPAGLTALPAALSTPPTSRPVKQKSSTLKRQKTAVMPGSQGGHTTEMLDAKRPKASAFLIAGALLAIGMLVAMFLWQRTLQGSTPPSTPALPTAVIVAALTDTPTLRAAAGLTSETPTPAPISAAAPTATPSKPPTRSPTATDVPTVPTSTSTAIPTLTPTTTPRATPTPKPTNTPASPSPKATATPKPPAPAVVALGSPAQGAVLTGSTTFTWQWDGPALAPNEAFEIRLWKEGQPDHYGAAEPVRTTSAIVDLAAAYAVQLGGSGQYLWTVAVVQTNPYQRIGEEAPPRSVTVEVGGGGGDDGGPGATPTPI